MKKILITFSAILAMNFAVNAQAPEGFKYQAVVRDASNAILVNQAVGMRMTIHQGTPSGTSVYSETFATTSNAYGLVNLEIGSGTTTDNFAAIDWSAGPYFMETAADLTGGTTYTTLGTAQLLSVPYALYAKNSGDAFSGDYNDLTNTPSNVSDFTNDAGYITSPDDADADPANEMNTGMALNGTVLELTDGAGTLTQDLDGTFATDAELASFVESDPIFGASAASGITAGDVTNWNTAYGWGDHSLAGYLTTEVDGSTTNEIQSLSLAGSDLTISGGNTVTLPTPASDINGTTNYVVKFTGATTGGNSQIIDNGTNIAIGAGTSTPDYVYVYKVQATATGDGQSSLYGYRTRDSQNDGTGYAYNTTNNAVKGYNYWGDVYTFGLGGFSYNDYTRTGGVLGAYQGGTYWGSLGYKNSASTTYGVYGSAAYASGTGFLPTTEAIGIGGGFFGDLIGSTSQGNVIGQLNSGDLFAQYNRGNVYTKGKNIELVETAGTMTPVYAVTSTEATVYAKGSIQLVNGTAYIPFDSKYAMLLGEAPVVTVSPNGECNGVYVSAVDAKGFTVKELMNGTSNAKISWIAVGNRIDNNPVDRATALVSAPNFDRNVEQVLYSDGNLEGSAMGIWWDGSTLQFGQLPENLSKVDRSEK